MNIVQHDNVEALLVRCEAHLLDKPDINHNILQILSVLLGDNDYHRPPYLFCSVEEHGKVIGCALHVLPDGLIVTDLPATAVGPLCNAVVENIPIPKRVIGPSVFAKELAHQLGHCADLKPTLSGDWVVARLNEVAVIKDHAGRLWHGTDADRITVADWGRQYGKEKPAFLDVSEFMLKKLDNGDLYFWGDDEPRSMMTVSGRSSHGVRISSVYTPPANRSEGNATAAVAALCQRLLDSGHRFVVLDWLVGDKASAIYMTVGFYRVGRRTSYVYS